ncbi:MAG: hypothetical protein ACYCR5_04880 [Leptospirillum sp.]
MEDIYRIQVSVGLNESIFTKLKELTGALNKADASVVRLTRSLRGLSERMRAIGGGAASSAMSVGKMETVLRSATAQSRLMNAQLLTSARRLAEVAKGAQNASASLRGVGGGILPVAGGMVAYEAVKGTVGAASEVQNKELQLRLMNLPKGEYQAIRAAVDGVTHTIAGTTLAGVTELARDLTTVLGAGKTKDVIRLLPGFARFQTTMQKVYGEIPQNMMIDAMRYMEHLPGVLSSPTLMSHEMNELFKVRALGGLVNPTQYFKAMQTGKTALAVTDDAFRYGPFASLMTGKSGYTLGTQVMSSYYALVGGHIQKGTATWLSSLGLMAPLNSAGKSAQGMAENAVDPSIRSRFSSSGAGYAVHEQIKGLKTYLSNPYEWSKKYLVPAIMKEHSWKHIDKHRTAIAAEEGQYFYRNVSDFLGQMVIRQPAIERDIQLISNLKSLARASVMANDTFRGAVENFTAAVKNFAASIGKGVLSPVTHTLNMMSGFSGRGNPFTTKTMSLPVFAATDYLVNTGQLGRSLAKEVRESLKGHENEKMTVQVIVDGKVLAGVMARHTTQRHTHPTGATFSNGAMFPATSGHGG